MNYYLYRLIPKKLVSAIFYKLSRIEIKHIKNSLIYLFCLITKANCDFAARKNKYEYKSLLDFFTRELAENARPIEKSEKSVVSPADGRCAIYGDIEEDILYQAKSQKYSLAALLNSQELAKKFHDGKTITIYLSPNDYHRIHAPCDCELIEMSFCPGNRHSVALDLLEKIPDIFVANERLVCRFNSELGEFILVFVGALNVGSIQTVWHGELKNNPETNHYAYDEKIKFKCADELGRFNLGSTVILCFEKKFNLIFNESKLDGRKILMGENIARSNN